MTYINTEWGPLLGKASLFQKEMSQAGITVMTGPQFFSLVRKWCFICTLYVFSTTTKSIWTKRHLKITNPPGKSQSWWWSNRIAKEDLKNLSGPRWNAMQHHRWELSSGWAIFEWAKMDTQLSARTHNYCVEWQALFLFQVDRWKIPAPLQSFSSSCGW